jgi:hypothetical protein
LEEFFNAGMGFRDEVVGDSDKFAILASIITTFIISEGMD